MEFNITAEQDNIRIDKYLAEKVPELSRSYIQKLLGTGDVLVNGHEVKARYKLHMKDRITVMVPSPEVLDILPENIPLDIIYEDEDILIVNKPKGMVVHPAPGHTTGTLVNALMYHCGSHLSTINGVMRPGIVHRIDKDTTGLLVVCKNNLAHQCLAQQLSNHSITRTYQAICYGVIGGTGGTVCRTIGRHPTDRKKQAVNVRNGKRALTNYTVLEVLQDKYTYIECSLETGRTHQIRVHMASLQHPLLGDTLYGPEKDPFRLQGQTLHAGVLGFLHPGTGQYVEFHADLPDYFKALLRRLRNGN